MKKSDTYAGTIMNHTATKQGQQCALTIVYSSEVLIRGVDKPR